MKHIHQILNKYLSNIDTSSLNRNGFEILNEYNVLSTDENRKKYLDRYIQEADTDLDKDRIQKMMRHTYQEACELI